VVREGERVVTIVALWGAVKEHGPDFDG